MPDEQEPGAPEPGSEDAFFQRMQSLMDASLSDERIGRAFDAWASKLNDEVEAEEAETPKRRQAKEANDDGEAERVEAEDEPEPSRAERRRASGGVGPGSRSGYWDHARRWIYGRNR